MSQPLPVICDQCRASGLAGAAPFADLADLLAFTPVPRRPHANGWSPEMQRGFIAALVATGSPARAARAIGKHAFGAEQLRRARGGQSFAAAWDAALELARERELAALREGLTELAAEQEDERHRRRSAILPAAERRPEAASAAASAAAPDPLDARARRRREAEEDAATRFDELAEAKDRIRARLTNARRLLLKLISPDPARRAAWEVLVGPTDWDRAERGEGQPDEPFHDAPPGTADPNAHNFTRPDMLLTAEAGLLSEFTGGPDPLEPLRRAMTAPAPDASDLSVEEQADLAAYREALKAHGWEEDDQGNLWSPAAPSAAE
jgi:hypothetical protein